MAIETKVKLRVIELRAEGLSFDKVAKQLGIAKQTAVDIAKENIDEIGTLQAINYEAFVEEKRVSSQGRIEQLSALQEKLRKEIEQRDLSDVPTEKLITLFIKTNETLKGEITQPAIRSTEEQRKDKVERQGLFY